MRSVKVVLPESMCALMPMFLRRLVAKAFTCSFSCHALDEKKYSVLRKKRAPKYIAQ
jgi:hypothetical protein